MNERSKFTKPKIQFCSITRIGLRLFGSSPFSVPLAPLLRMGFSWVLSFSMLLVLCLLSETLCAELFSFCVILMLPTNMRGMCSMESDQFNTMVLTKSCYVVCLGLCKLDLGTCASF